MDGQVSLFDCKMQKIAGSGNRYALSSHNSVEMDSKASSMACGKRWITSWKMWWNLTFLPQWEPIFSFKPCLLACSDVNDPAIPIPRSAKEWNAAQSVATSILWIEKSKLSIRSGIWSLCDLPHWLEYKLHLEMTQSKLVLSYIWDFVSYNTLTAASGSKFL